MLSQALTKRLSSTGKGSEALGRRSVRQGTRLWRAQTAAGIQQHPFRVYVG
jgi:hypothetical protein